MSGGPAPSIGRIVVYRSRTGDYSEHGRSENVAGCYQEWDIPFDGAVDAVPAGNPDDVAPGTWRWPVRSWTVRPRA